MPTDTVREAQTLIDGEPNDTRSSINKYQMSIKEKLRIRLPLIPKSTVEFFDLMGENQGEEIKESVESNFN